MLGRSDKFRSWIPQGFDYLSVQTTERLLGLQDQLRQIFRVAGYREVMPPTFDYSRTFRLAARDADRRLLFETRDVDGENLTVRSDLTVQMVKAAANGRFGNGLPLKLSYIQPIFQDRPWGSGRSREVIQAGVEWIGAAEDARVAELLALARQIAEALGLAPRLLYGDVRFLDLLLAAVPGEQRASFSEALYNKDSSRIRQLAEEAALEPRLARLLTEVPLIFGQSDALARLSELCAHDRQLTAIIEDARQHPNVVFDFSMVRELSYYSGPVFQGFVPGQTEPLLSGGVYDQLHAEFSGRSAPACGFALNLSLLL